ncbi:DUF6483 family protein [Clostridium sp. JNZ X4-2]
MNDDYILRIIESAGKFLQNLVSNRQDQGRELQNIDVQSMSVEDILTVLLKKMIIQGKYNEAENMLFEELNKNPSDELIHIGENFYDMLFSKSDEQLSEGNFSRKEIFQGLEDMKKFKN